MRLSGRLTYGRNPAALAVLAGTLLLGTPAPASAATTSPVCASACFLDVRTGGHTDFDRLVVDLGGSSLPTWTATTTDTGLWYESGDEGHPIALTAKHYLALRFTGVNNTATDGTWTFGGPSPQTVNHPSLKGYALTGGYEGAYGFGLALDDYRSYRVFTLTSPNRVVVDVYH
ncbi:AMIN-like domain-containing (lipo)protein [Streptomyces aureus]